MRKNNLVLLIVLLCSLICGQPSVVCAENINVYTDKALNAIYDVSAEIGKSDDIEAFPESYKEALYALKAVHPNWTFIMYDTGLDWSTVLYNEMNPSNRSLVPSYFDSSFAGTYYGDGWSCATQLAVEYYLDPRNWLTENYIFQFEVLSYNANVHGIATVQKVLANTFMSGYIEGYEDMKLTYAQAFYDIGRSIGVSPVHLATRVKQEQGVSGTSELISGTYPGYEGYYNYYNIQATGATREEIIINGLNEAKSEGWNNRYVSLLNGSTKVAQRYILRGQDTIYLQKFDVDGSYDGRYWHQYMQNLCAPSNEAYNVKRAYEAIGMLNEAFVFKIPVYNNMPKSGVTEFVERLYEGVLGRKADEDGLDGWVSALENGEATAADVGVGFIFGEEYESKNVSDEKYVDMLYHVLFDREPDAEGKAQMLELLSNGVSRKYIYAQFIESNEFISMCEKYEILPGSVTLVDACDQNVGVTGFVARCYEKILGRTFDRDGLNNWCTVLLNGEKSPAEVAADGFLNSEEFISKALSDSEFISVLYRTFLNREPDSEGLSNWLTELAEGMSKDYVLHGFAESQEFTDLCSQYGMERGSYSLSAPRDMNPGVTKFVIRCYKMALGRGYDEDGLNDWCNRILSGECTPVEVAADGFFHSQEFLEKNLNDEEYVHILYRTFLGRQADETGLADWLDRMKNQGWSRDDVLEGFAGSQEFIGIMAEYGL